MVRAGASVWLAVVVGASLGLLAAWPQRDDPQASLETQPQGAIPAPRTAAAPSDGPPARPDPAPHARDPFGVRDWGGHATPDDAIRLPAVPAPRSAGPHAQLPAQPERGTFVQTAAQPEPPGDNAPGIGLEPPPPEVPE